MVDAVKKLMSSGLEVTLTHMEILHFFRRNPGVMDDVDGIALRLGLERSVVERCIYDLVRLGILASQNIGGKTIVTMMGG
jgi:predicted transcriptional regulator